MVALNDMRAALLQPRNDFIGKLIFEDTVAEAQQFIDVPHCLQGQIKAQEIAMEIGNDTNFQRSVSGLKMRSVILAALCCRRYQ
jgi:hypothetical protein